MKSKPKWFYISAFFQDAQNVETVIGTLLTQGVPRDLIAVAVTEKQADRFFKGKGHTLSHRLSGAAKGALYGLITSSVLSLALIATSYGRDSTYLTFIMLLGPNMGVVIGAIGGLLLGFLKPVELAPQYKRISEQRDGILLCVRTKNEEETVLLKEELTKKGGLDSRIECM